MTTRRDFLKSAALFGGFPMLSSLSLAAGAAGSTRRAGVLAQDDEAGTTEYKLPPLPYLPEALEPHIDGRTMRIHHLKTHASYVIGLNRTLKKLQEARDKNDFSDVQPLSRALAFHAGGYVNHIIYFNNMAPVGRGGGEEPTGELADRITADFGSLDKLKAHLSAAALKVEGNGWGVLGYHLVLKRLLVTQMMNQQNLNPIGLVPLLLIDVWEHAYYLKYQNKRNEYIKAWWNVVNWADAAKRYKIATV